MSSKLTSIRNIIEDMLPTNSQQLITAAVLRSCLDKILLTESSSVDKVKADLSNLLLVDDFDPNQSYSQGEVVLYECSLKEFTTSHSGPWNSQHVKDTNLKDLITKFFMYHGSITPTSQKINTDLKVMYLATQPGTYTNFGSISLANGEIAFILQNGSTFTKNTIFTLAQTVGTSKTQTMSQDAITKESYLHPYTSKDKTTIISALTEAVKNGSREY